MKNILVSVNFEEKFSRLIDMASELAEMSGAKVWILHVAAPDPDFVGYEVGPQYIRDVRADDLREEHRLLQKFISLMKANGIDAEGLLIQGATTEMILAESERLKTDLVIIGHHDHGILYETFVGSNAKNIINKSKIPVMIVPLDQE